MRKPSSTPRAYAFIDAALPIAASPILYYRLRQVDNDGRAAYSRVVFVPAAEGFALFPNPSQGEVTVRFAQPEAAQLWLVSASGQTVWQTDDLPAGATAALNQRLATLPPGFYVLRVQQGSIADKQDHTQSSQNLSHDLNH